MNWPPTTCSVGSCAAIPARIVSSVDTASTWPCWSITRQSDQLSTETGTSFAGSVAIFAADVDFFAAHTRLPVRSASFVTFDSLVTRIRCPAL